MYRFLGSVLACLLIFLALASNKPLAYDYTTGMIGDLVVSLKVSKTQDEQSLGLGGTIELAEDEGMLFVYDKDAPNQRIFWMKGMLIPIDIIWLLNCKIVHIEHNVLPPSSVVISDIPTYGHGIIADQVMEFKAGFATKNSIKIGSRVSLMKYCN